MEKEQPTKDAPTKCAGDCGFFGYIFTGIV